MSLTFANCNPWSLLTTANESPGDRSRAIASRAPAGLLAATGVLVSSPATAHVSEQALVLLLPTDVYTAAGIAVVVLTILVLAYLPSRISAGLFRTASLRGVPDIRIVSGGTSLFFLAVLTILVFSGFMGSRDPLENPLPLFIWTVWWMAFIVCQGTFGNLWYWVNPWTGLHCLLSPVLDRVSRPVLPERLGAWPGVVIFFVFGAFFLAYPAPDDPERLAWVVLAYVSFTFAGMCVFGADEWLERCECFTMLLRAYARLAPISPGISESRAGFPGWSIVSAPALSSSQAVFVLVILGIGSFDGLNETFWWLAKLGVNPLEFPGRSAIVGETIFGLVGANVLLVCLFAGCVQSGLFLLKRMGFHSSVGFCEAFGRLALSIIPIAFGYHIAHFLTALLVNGQYALIAFSDPFSTGANYLGFADTHVTTGFFNSLDSVRVIWLTQAGAVIVGHVVAILLAHAIAVDMFGSRRAAVTSQVPMATFMVFYTLLGLWLLASPRGA